MGARESAEGISTDVLPPVLPGMCVVVGGGVGDDDGLPWGGARVYHHVSRRRFWGYLDDVGGGRRNGVPLCWCDGRILLDGEEELVAVHR